MPPPLKPDDEQNRGPDNTINWAEFRDSLLQSQTAMQNAITALTQALF